MVLKNGLSRMRGDSHVRFLGEGMLATACPYPTQEAGTGPTDPRIGCVPAFFSPVHLVDWRFLLPADLLSAAPQDRVRT